MSVCLSEYRYVYKSIIISYLLIHPFQIKSIHSYSSIVSVSELCVCHIWEPEKDRKKGERASVATEETPTCCSWQTEGGASSAAASAWNNPSWAASSLKTSPSKCHLPCLPASRWVVTGSPFVYAPLKYNTYALKPPFKNLKKKKKKKKSSGDSYFGPACLASSILTLHYL